MFTFFPTLGASEMFLASGLVENGVAMRGNFFGLGAQESYFKVIPLK